MRRVLGVCLLMCLASTPALALTFAWDRPVMPNGVAIPCEAHLLYRVSWGSAPRTSDTYVYPSRSVRTNLRTMSVAPPSGATRCFAVRAYVGKDHAWEEGGTQYTIKAGEGFYSRELCFRVP